MSRHSQIADDSDRLNVIIPKCHKDILRPISSVRKNSISGIVREYITVGIEKDIEKYGIKPEA